MHFTSLIERLIPGKLIGGRRTGLKIAPPGSMLVLGINLSCIIHTHRVIIRIVKLFILCCSRAIVISQIITRLAADD